MQLFASLLAKTIGSYQSRPLLFFDQADIFFDSGFGQNPVSTQVPQFQSMKDSCFKILANLKPLSSDQSKLLQGLILQPSFHCSLYSWYSSSSIMTLSFLRTLVAAASTAVALIMVA
jgi:hypothetical protein